MSIKALCPRCERKHVLDDRFDGKKIRCKGCDKSFVVGEPNDDEDEKPRKGKKKKKKTQGAPVMLFALIGGGVLLLLMCVGGGVGIYFAVRSSGTPVARNNDPPPGRKDPLANDSGKPGKFGPILDEMQASVGRTADALARVANDAAVRDATTAIRDETNKANVLVNRLLLADAPSSAERQRMRDFDRELAPHFQRLQGELQRLNQALPPGSFNELKDAVQGYLRAGKSFDGVLRDLAR